MPLLEEEVSEEENIEQIILENLVEEEIDISESDPDADVGKNFHNYTGKVVLFKNCPNLKKINASCLNIIGLKIEDCPQLEELSAYNNEIRKIDLSGLDNLKTVNLSFNKLK